MFIFTSVWERDIPFIPALSVFYVSLTPLLCLAPFVIRNICDFRVLFKVMVTETIIGAVCFLLLPVESGYPSRQVSGFFAPVYNFADHLNLTYNELPSLHVAFAYTAAIIFGQRLQYSGRILLLIWASLIAISTLFTHQHPCAKRFRWNNISHHCAKTLLVLL